MSGFSIPTPPPPSPSNKHTLVLLTLSRVCVGLHTQHINENHLQPHHSAWHISKIVMAYVFVFVRALGFFRSNLTCPMETRAVVYKAMFGPWFRCAETVLTPCLTDAVMKGVKVRGRLHVSSCTARVVLA